jgi:hypothetical protein
MIDYLLSFTNEAAARADPVVGAFWIASASSWRQDVCIPGVAVVNAATAVAVSSNWNIIIAQTDPNAALAAHANRVAWMNRDTGAIVSPTALGVWRARAVLPLFAGPGYPSLFGALTGATGAV